MSHISVVTPWRDHPEFIADYELAVVGAQVIIVDNASRPENALKLRAMVNRLNGIYLRNEINTGFSVANNQGLANAGGDIVLFLNNDIVAEPGFLDAVRRDVSRDDALVGPALRYQNIFTMPLAYLEGWCIAARRQVWDRLGGWDAAAYPGPYWEDSDLCFRASVAGMALVPATWPIQHKGDQARMDRLTWGLSYERNRATFAARVRPHYERMCAVNGITPWQTPT
jgi:O-antigen biosynthesis protein